MDKIGKNTAIVFISPIFLFFLIGSLEPYGNYAAVYILKIFAVTLAAAFCFRRWTQLFPLRVTRWTLLAALLGGLGTVLWVGLTQFQHTLLGETAARAGFNPFEFWGPNAGFEPWAFWGIRMFGLAVVVPLVEEVFLRGFLLRYIYAEFPHSQTPWYEIPAGALSLSVWGATCFYAAATHPEWMAALAWFGFVTWYVNRTKNIWDAVILHAVTNGVLGLYVLFSGNWGFM